MRRVHPAALMLATLGVGLATGGTVSADESRIRLAPAPEATLVRARCAVCHSLDYILMNSPILNRAGWEAEVRKMIKVMGAPVADDEVAPIVAYLSAHYGAD